MSRFSHYNELQVKPTSNLEDFCDFALSLGIEAVEYGDDFFLIRSVEDLNTVKWGLEEFAKSLSEIFKKNIQVGMVLKRKPNEDWIEKYKNSVKPIEIGSFYIRPSWEKERQGFKNIIIDPALAFGSGHHESTSACLEALEGYVKKGDEVLDIGCGSGILSFASTHLGALSDACDTDPQAIKASKKNAQINNIKLNRIWKGSIDKAEKVYDLIVANIIADVLLTLADDLQEKLKKGGFLILSGILEKYEKRILKTFDALKLVEIKAKNEWRTIIFYKG